jgi:preprotein translocase subunit SecG
MWLSIVIPILLGILVIVCVLLTLVVLMQRPKNEGLGAAFGSGVTENIFGAQTATVLTKATVYLGFIFFGVTLMLTVLTARQSINRRVGVLESEVHKAAVAPAPKTTASPATQSSPQTTATVAAPATASASGTPATSATPAVSATPAASARPESSTTPSVPASASPSAESDSAPKPAASGEQSSPAPSTSTRH